MYKSSFLISAARDDSYVRTFSRGYNLLFCSLFLLSFGFAKKEPCTGLFFIFFILPFQPLFCDLPRLYKSEGKPCRVSGGDTEEGGIIHGCLAVGRVGDGANHRKGCGVYK